MARHSDGSAPIEAVFSDSFCGRTRRMPDRDCGWVAGAYFVGSLLESLLFGVAAHTVTLSLGAVVLLAKSPCWHA